MVMRLGFVWVSSARGAVWAPTRRSLKDKNKECVRLGNGLLGNKGGVGARVRGYVFDSKENKDKIVAMRDVC